MLSYWLHQNKSTWKASSLSYTVYHNITAGIWLRVFIRPLKLVQVKHQSNLKRFINDTWYLLAVCKLQGVWLPQHTSHILGMPTVVMAHPRGWCNSHVSCRLLALTPRLHRPTGAHTEGFSLPITWVFCWQDQDHQGLCGDHLPLQH